MMPITKQWQEEIVAEMRDRTVAEARLTRAAGDAIIIRFSDGWPQRWTSVRKFGDSLPLDHGDGTQGRYQELDEAAEVQ
jgi:hypothetical protein